MATNFVFQDRPLYVIRARQQESGPARELTALEKLAGWRDGETYTHEKLAVNEWHESGRMHSFTAPAILAWDVQPGEEVLVVLRARFKFEVVLGDGVTTSTCLRAVSAKCEPAVAAAHTIQSHRFLVKVNTDLARSVMLGEDGAEDAFRETAIEEQLAAALDDDWRRSACSVELIDEPEEDAAYAEFVRKRKAWTVKVEKPVEVA